jgi:hypothetical protein
MKFVALLRNNERECWFQQDGATPHMQPWKCWKSFFGHRIISKGLWPPRSPDLLPLDFYLWSFLKSCVFDNSPRTASQLKLNNETALGNIEEVMLQNVSQNITHGTGL